MGTTSRDEALAVSTTTSSGDVASLLEQLARLRDAGVLSEEEFTSKKKELLDRL